MIDRRDRPDENRDIALGTDLVDPDDSTYVAESELLHAAQSIESAAKKLSSLKPRRQVQVCHPNTLRREYSLRWLGVDMLDIWLCAIQFNRMLFISTPFTFTVLFFDLLDPKRDR